MRPHVAFCLIPLLVAGCGVTSTGTGLDCRNPGGLSEAFVIEGDGAGCGMRRADGGSVGAVSVQCGAETGNAAGCNCGKNAAGQLQFFCTGGCTPDMQPLCVITNCGDINCVSGATCVARGRCEAS